MKKKFLCKTGELANFEGKESSLVISVLPLCLIGSTINRIENMLLDLGDRRFLTASLSLFWKGCVVQRSNQWITKVVLRCKTDAYNIVAIQYTLIAVWCTRHKRHVSHDTIGDDFIITNEMQVLAQVKANSGELLFSLEGTSLSSTRQLSYSEGKKLY